MSIQIDDILQVGRHKFKDSVRTHNKGMIETEIQGINFQIKKDIFMLKIYYHEGIWQPDRIWHQFDDYYKSCPYCNLRKMFGDCRSLNEELNEIFAQVINHPKVRLKKLFF